MKKILIIFLMSFNLLQANIFEAIQKKNIDWVKSCIGGGEGNSPYNLGMTPLHVAVIHNFYEAVVALVEAGVDVNTRDGEGCTPLYYATNNENELIANYLIENSASVLIIDKAGETPLHIASKRDNLDIGFSLLKGGASPDGRSSGGNTPREIASPRMKEMFKEEDRRRSRSE